MQRMFSAFSFRARGREDRRTNDRYLSKLKCKKEATSKEQRQEERMVPAKNPGEEMTLKVQAEDVFQARGGAKPQMRPKP